MPVGRVGRTLGAVGAALPQVVRAFVHHPRHLPARSHRFAAAASGAQTVGPSRSCFCAAVRRLAAVSLCRCARRCRRGLSAHRRLEHGTALPEAAVRVPAGLFGEEPAGFWRSEARLRWGLVSAAEGFLRTVGSLRPSLLRHVSRRSFRRQQLIN